MVKKCPKCLTEVGKKATECPECGYSPGKKKREAPVKKERPKRSPHRRDGRRKRSRRGRSKKDVPEKKEEEPLPEKKSRRKGKRARNRTPQKKARYNPSKDPAVKTFNTEIEELEDRIVELKTEVKEAKVPLENLENAVTEKQKALDDFIEEKGEIEEDIQKSMDCPKCEKKVKLAITDEDTLHLVCKNCNAKGRLPNPNADVLKDLEDVNADIEEAEKELEGAREKLADIENDISEKEENIKGLEEDALNKKEEKDIHIQEMKKKGGKQTSVEEKEEVEDEVEEEVEDEVEEEEESVDEDSFCPMCYADLEPPFKKCPGCGWKEEGDHSDQKSVLDGYEDEEEDDDYDSSSREEASKDHYQVPCRCGSRIDIWTAKRPTRIRCDNCGAKGLLKSMGKKISDDYHGDFKYEKPSQEGKEPSYKSGRPSEPKKRKKGRRKAEPRQERGRARKPQGKKMSKKEIQDRAFKLLSKLENYLDKAAKQKLYFQDIEDEVEYIEEDIKKAKSPAEMESIMKEITKMGKEIAGAMRQ